MKISHYICLCALLTLVALVPYPCQANTYYVPAPFLPWIWPALAVSGIALQLLAYFIRKRYLILLGTVLTLTGSLPERDVTLAVGDILACAGLWYCLSKG